MEIQLTAFQTRLIGALIEKEFTTPDQYPLSLNALTNACNQKSNREPVMSLDEVGVQQTLDELSQSGLIMEVTGFGSRVVKYRHRFCNTEFSKLQLSEQELAVICVLLLRGAQTPGELRTRTNRLCSFSDVSEVEVLLDQLQSRSDGPFVEKLLREPGKRESRYRQLFSIEEPVEELESLAVNDANEGSSDNARIAALEQKVAELQDEVELLKMQFEEL